MKRFILVFVFGLAFSISSFAADIPCDPLSANLEFYTCHMWDRSYKVGIKTERTTFCEELKQVTPSDGCVLKGFTGKGIKAQKGENAPIDEGEYLLVVGPTNIENTSYDFQCDPPNLSGGIVTLGTHWLGSLPGFTVNELPGKSNNDRIGSWIDYQQAKGKKYIGGAYFRDTPYKGTNQMCIMYKEGKKLYELRASIKGR